MTAMPPIQFDRASGALEGANLWERTAALALSTGAKVSSRFLASRLQSLRQSAAQGAAGARYRDPAQRGCDASNFPLATVTGASCSIGRTVTRVSWNCCSCNSSDVDYTLIDGGANYGYWSVLVSSAPFGKHRAIAIEPSSQNFRQACQQRARQRRSLRGPEVRDRIGARHRAAIAEPSTRPSASSARPAAAARMCR